MTEATNLSFRRLTATTSFSYSPNPISDSPFLFIHFWLQLRHTSLNAGLSLLSFTLLLSIRRKFTLETSPFLLNHHQRDMVSPETTNWLFDYALIDDIPVPDDANFSAPTAGFSWSMQPFNASSDVRFYFSLIFFDFPVLSVWQSYIAPLNLTGLLLGFLCVWKFLRVCMYGLLVVI